jgi:hypothetical protein
MFETQSEERAPMRSAADSSNPLQQQGILPLVLDFLGPGAHIFLSTVSSGFRACYLKVPTYMVAYTDSSDNNIEVTLGHHMTTCSALFGSLSCLHLALELGFVPDPASWSCQFNAGRVADIETLRELHEQHQMPYTEDVSRGAARSGSVSKLQWLLDEQQCPAPDNLDCAAVYAPTLDMLKWVKQRGCVFTADTCAAAAKSMRAADVLQYLQCEGVAFDFRTMVTAISYQDLQLVQWLHEHGCPLSQAAALAAASLQELTDLSWLHSVGCPCDYDFLCLSAASVGDIDLLQWMKVKGAVDWSPEGLSNCLNIAAARNQTDTAKVCAYMPDFLQRVIMHVVTVSFIRCALLHNVPHHVGMSSHNTPCTVVIDCTHLHFKYILYNAVVETGRS